MVRTLALALAATGILSATAEAQGAVCGPRDRVVAHLAENYGESRQSAGLAGTTALVEVFANLDTGSWTITVTRPDGSMCLMASGEGFQILAETLPAGAPA